MERRQVGVTGGTGFLGGAVARGAPAFLLPARTSARFAAGALAAFALWAAHAALVWSLDGLPLQDVPNHLARAVISADLLFHGGRRFGEGYAIHPAFTPYVLPDLLLAGLVGFGPNAAARLFTLAVVTSLPAAMAISLRALRHGPATVLAGAALGLYLGTGWFFLMGFQAYQLSVSLSLVALAAWQRYLRTGTASGLAAFTALVVAGFLAHLSSLLFVGAGAAVTGLLALRRRAAPLGRVLAGAVPLLALGAWYAASAGAPPGLTIWDGPLEKARRLASPFRRFGLATDVAFAAAFAASLAAAAWGVRPRDAWRRARVAVPGALALVFLALYLAMPMARGIVWYIDSRALTYVAVFGTFSALGVADGGPRRARGLVLGLAAALALALANVAVLRVHLARANEASLAFREIAVRAPPGAAVLTVATRPKRGAYDPLLHAGLFATIEVGARTPYLFSSGVTPYFTTRHPLPAPPEFWYLGDAPLPRDAAPAGSYDRVLLARPYDPGRLPFATHVVASNDVADLLAIDAPAPAAATRRR